MESLLTATFGLCRWDTKMDIHVSTSWMWMAESYYGTCLCKNIINCNLHEPYGLCLRGSNNDLFLVEESGNGNKSSPLKNNLNAYIYIYVDFTNV